MRGAFEIPVPVWSTLKAGTPLIVRQPSDAAIIRRAMPIAVPSSDPLDKERRLNRIERTYRVGELTAHLGESPHFGAVIAIVAEPGQSHWPRFSRPLMDRGLSSVPENRPIQWSELGSELATLPQRDSALPSGVGIPTCIVPTLRRAGISRFAPAQTQAKPPVVEHRDGMAGPCIAVGESVAALPEARLPRPVPTNPQTLASPAVEPLPIAAATFPEPARIEMPAAMAPPKRVGAPLVGSTTTPRMSEDRNLRPAWHSGPFAGDGPVTPREGSIVSLPLTVTPRALACFANTLTDGSPLALAWQLANCYTPRDRQIYMIEAPRPAIVRDLRVAGFRPCSPAEARRWETSWDRSLHPLDAACTSGSGALRSAPLPMQCQESLGAAAVAPALCEAPVPHSRKLPIWRPAPADCVALPVQTPSDAVATSLAPSYPLGVRPFRACNIAVAPGAAAWNKPSNSYNRPSRSSGLLGLVQGPKLSLATPGFARHAGWPFWNHPFEAIHWSAVSSTAAALLVVPSPSFSEVHSVRYPTEIQCVSNRYVIRHLKADELWPNRVLPLLAGTPNLASRPLRTIGLRPRTRLPQSVAHLT